MYNIKTNRDQIIELIFNNSKQYLEEVFEMLFYFLIWVYMFRVANFLALLCTTAVCV